MSIFRPSDKTADTGAEAPKANFILTPKEQEDRDNKALKAANEAADKAKAKPLDAHGNPMPDLNAPAREQVKAAKK